MSDAPRGRSSDCVRVAQHETSAERSRSSRIAAILVVFVHLGGPGGFTASSMAGQNPFWVLHPIGNTGVDIFFAISGLIMIVTTSRVHHDASSAWRFLLRRAIRIYPPYIIVTLVLFAPSLLHPDVAGSLPGLVSRSPYGRWHNYLSCSSGGL